MNLFMLAQETTSSMPDLFYLAPIGAIVALIMAFVFSKGVMAQSEGEPEMIKIAEHVRAGAMAYLKRQYKVVFIVFVVLIAILAALGFAGIQPVWTAVGVPIAGLFSGLCGWFGMKMATNASARTTWAVKKSLNDGLKVAFRSGAVMGLVVVGFALLDASVWFYVWNEVMPGKELVEITSIMLTFGMGASTQALFARVGGGVYTKAADVGADLVGKIEAGIPEDDPRNPATIADNVGDNVGDVAGMGADLYESYYGSILATMALGAAAAMGINFATPELANQFGMSLAVAPMALAGLGIFCSLVGVFVVRAKENASFSELLKGLHKGVYVASLLIAVLCGGLFYLLFKDVEVEGFVWWGPWASIITGLVSGLIIAYATEYYTSYEHAPTKRIAKQTETGAATVIIAGIAEGMISTWAPLIVIVVAIIASFGFAGGNENFLLGLYGVGIAAVGMLSTLGITLATDAYGPIADNAGGNAEMTGQPPIVRERTDMLDSLGNTTAATGKGFAIGSAALTALALLAAYVSVVQTSLDKKIVADIAMVEEASGTVAYLGNGEFVANHNGETFGGLMISSYATQRALEDLDWAEGSLPADITDLNVNENTHAVTVGDVSFSVVPSHRAEIKQLLSFYDVSIMNPKVLGGIFLGVMLAFVFCALTMNAVGRAAFEMMNECRRQFGVMKKAFKANGMSDEDIEDPMNWPKEQTMVDGVAYPDYGSCVDISTASAQREMILPAILAISVPIIVGLLLGVGGVMGLLVGGLTSGFAVAIYMANAGGAWDNAKKYIESGAHGGKGSDAHKASIVGDTVGDPFKDTSGPALNILIKLIAIVSVVFAGLVVNFGPVVQGILGL
jgi:K(+)-stimulated pyrophosphate-energized sodium pump